MKKTIIDFESFFDLKNGVSVSSQGVPNYVRDSDAYCVSIVDDDMEYCGPLTHALNHFPGSFWAEPDREWWAANSNFEQGWAEKYWPEAKSISWNCVLDVGVGNQFPRDLANLARVALDEKVDKSIRDNMNGVRFESLSEEKQQAIIDYCLNDSVVEKRVVETLPPLTTVESEIAAHTRLINRRGVYIDVDRVEGDLTKLQEIRHRAFKAIPWHLTDKPLSQKAMGRYCELNGIEMPTSLDKRDEECTELMSRDPRLKKIIDDLRAYRNSNTSIEKAGSLNDRITADGRLPLDLLYCGAPHTRRWSSQGFNIQNLAKEPTFLDVVLDEKGKPDMEKSTYVWAREWFIPAPGKTFLILDFSQIEPRCLNWLVGNDEMLAMIASGYEIYEAHAMAFKGWKGAPGTMRKTHKDLRDRCKVEVLGMGYGMGATKAKDYAASYGVDLTDAEAKTAVDGFRAGNPKIPAFWSMLDGVMKNAILRPDKSFAIEMPTGDYLRHFHLQQTMKTNPDTGKKRLVYSSSKVKGIFDSRARVHNLWGGTLTENVTQRMARDVMAEAMLRVEKAGFTVRFHVHDEVILEIDKGSDKFLADAKAEAERLLTITPDWAEGLPLAVEGGYADRYCK
jgi:DNA polymerase bacteriophage-type